RGLALRDEHREELAQGIRREPQPGWDRHGPVVLTGRSLGLRAVVLEVEGGVGGGPADLERGRGAVRVGERDVVHRWMAVVVVRIPGRADGLRDALGDVKLVRTQLL